MFLTAPEGCISSFDNMHRIFLIPEVLTFILEHMVEEIPPRDNMRYNLTQSGGALSHTVTARVCKTWLVPSIDILWKSMWSLSPLINILGPVRYSEPSYYWVSDKLLALLVARLRPPLPAGFRTRTNCQPMGPFLLLLFPSPEIDPRVIRRSTWQSNIVKHRTPFFQPSTFIRWTVIPHAPGMWRRRTMGRLTYYICQRNQSHWGTPFASIISTLCQICQIRRPVWRF